MNFNRSMPECPAVYPARSMDTLVVKCCLTGRAIKHKDQDYKSYTPERIQHDFSCYSSKVCLICSHGLQDAHGVRPGSGEPGQMHSILTVMLQNRDAQGGQNSLSQHRVDLYLPLSCNNSSPRTPMGLTSFYHTTRTGPQTCFIS